jgi:DNA polymerase IIIc chi subunit
VNVLTIELALQQSRHLVRDIHTNIGTRHAQIEAARERWRQFRAQGLDAAPDPAPAERAA